MQSFNQYLKIVSELGRVTFRDITKDKILYNSLFIAMFVIGLSYFASELTFVRKDRIVINLCLFLIHASNIFIAIFMGSSMIQREIQSRTIYVALSKPITRFQFLLGKVLGLFYVLIVNWGILIAVFSLVLIVVAPNAFSITLFWALVFTLIQSWMMGSIAVLFSSFSTTSLAVIKSIGIYFIGQNISFIQSIAEKSGDSFRKLIIEGITYVIPNFEKFQLGTNVTYQLPLSSQFIIHSIVYGFVTIVLINIISRFLFNRKEI